MDWDALEAWTGEIEAELDAVAASRGRRRRRRTCRQRRPLGPLANGSRLKVPGGAWAVPASRAEGGPSSLWAMASREILLRSLKKPQNDDISEYMRHVSDHPCNEQFSNPRRGDLATLAFLPRWDRKTRRKKVGAGGGFGMLFLPWGRPRVGRR